MHSNIRDDGAVLRIDTASRRIIIPPECRVIGVAGDCNSEQLTINCPRYIEGHDMVGCAMKWVGWTNAHGKHGETKLQVDSFDDESIRFIWTAPAGLLTAAGPVSISIHFMDVNAIGQVVYKLATVANKELRVLEGPAKRLEDGVALAYAETDSDGSGLLEIEVDEAKLNAAAYAAARRVLNG